jgi:uncharacterized protein YfaS (alpha-2-macroglobulin family)
MRNARAVFALILLVFAIPSMGKEPPVVKEQAAWKEIDRLISELKLQEASARLDELLPELRKAGDDSWMRALVRGTQLRAASAEPEEAVRFLKSQEWPEGRRERAVLSLFYAEALKNYYNNYRWEIWEREAIQSKEPTEISKWTAGQVFEAASQAYLDAWKDREALGSVPVAGFSDFLTPNNYPKEVRGTLRDTLSYLWVQLLADTGYWSPRQTNATAHFDLAALFRGEGEPGPEQLGDPTVHPLLRALTVLSDLERWHRSQGTPGGALEARLERVRRLRQHALAPDLEALAKELEAVLPEYRKTSWWSMGMAELADVRRSRGDLIQAVEAAKAGAAAYPGSPGAKTCLAIENDVEAPTYQVAVTASDGLARRSIKVVHKNLPALWFRAYPFDLEGRLRRDGPLFPGRAAELVKSGKPAFAWKAALPATPDYREHATYLVPPIDRPGAYYLVASARQDFAEKENQITGTPFILGGMVLLTRSPRDGKGLEVEALDGEHGEPLPGVAVSLYKVEGWEHRERQETGTTDGQGRLLFNLQDTEGYALAARKGDDVGFILSYFQEEPEPDEEVRSLVFTDRSIYRPNQKVLWKVLAYENRGEGRLQVADTSLTVSLVDPNNQAVESLSVSTNEFGTASGEFVVPPGRPLGNWRVETSRSGMASIRVEEYKRPTFEVTLKDPAEPLRLGRPASFTGEGRYYFGLPVTHGEVTWRVVRQPVYLWSWFGETSNEETVATGTAMPDADGRFTITFTPDPGGPKGRDVRNLTYRYKVSADLTDEGGETRKAERSFRLGWVSIEAEIEPASSLLLAGKPGAVTIERRDLDGIGRAGDGKWTLVSLRQPAETPLPADLPMPETDRNDSGFHTEGDRLRSRAAPGYEPRAVLALWEDGPEIASGTVRHGEDGKAGLALPALEPGAYRLRYETADASGETFSTFHDLIVGGSETRLALPAVLEVDDSEAHPGGRIRVLAHSGFADQLVRLETWRGSKLIRETLLRMGRDSNLIDIPIGKEDRGGFSLKLVTLRDFQLVELQVNIWVPWDDRRLEIETATFRDLIRPGGRETWTVKVRPAEGEGIVDAAELLASMYDRSLDLFAPHHPPDPLALYPNLMGTPTFPSSLGERYAGWIGGSGLQHYVRGADLQPDEIRFAFAFQPEIANPMMVDGGVEGGVVGGVAGGVPAPPPPPPPSPQAVLQKTPGILMDRINVGGNESAQSAPGVELRSEFAETAFWEPHLLTDKDGTASIEFTVPDSVTSWTFWVRAFTRDFRAGSLEKEVRTVKDLMVRPYLPRFLREGDKAELQVVVNNASEAPLSGEVVIEILEPGTDTSRLADFGLKPAQARARFTAEAGSGTTVRFPLTTPRGVGSAAFKVTAVAGDTSDGELRELPVLPSRMHLVQSRFVSLQGESTREMRFEDMTKPDSTRIDEQLVVTLDAQLFQGVLAALPYLVNYPYECTEQTLNRFLSTGIVSGLFDKYPAVAAMAREFSKRETRFETWDTVDPNRKMTLEETPWLELSQGGRASEDPLNALVNVLDERVARAQRDEALMKLRQAQLSEGGFPWWPGGPPSPYMTLYLLYGFARASEAGIDVPRDMIENGWSYIADYYRTEEKPRMADRKCCRELLVFLNYVASAYPDPSWMGEGGLTPEERKEILADSFAHWRELSGYLKSLLAMTLYRMDRPADALLVFGAVLDLAKTTEDEGTFWAPEEHGWLWYNDDVETHAFALQALMEIAPDDPRRHGLVQWLFLNKQLNHWKSTRATAEVLYALVQYLEKEGKLAVREEAAVRVGGQTTTFVFEPDRFTGKHNQVVLPGEKIDPATSSRVVVENRGPNLMFASATWHFSTEELPKESRGDLFGVTRRYFLRTGTGEAFVLKPLEEGTVLKPGDEVEVQLAIYCRAAAEYVHLRDPRPAGLEPGAAVSGYRWDVLGHYEETRDSGTNFFFDWLPAGEYTLTYRLRANMAGVFRTGPATLQSMYAPEFTAYSAGDVVTVAH